MKVRKVNRMALRCDSFPGLFLIITAPYFNRSLSEVKVSMKVPFDFAQGTWIVASINITTKKYFTGKLCSDIDFPLNICSTGKFAGF
jgi:hypothetical protein